jgi:membrane-associated phospholipid phosphatase
MSSLPNQAVRVHAMRCMLATAVVITSLLAACAQPPAASAVGPARATWASATSTNQWNEYATELIARNAVGQFPALRTLAYMNLAIHNGIVQARSEQLDPEGAAAGAAAVVLGQLFPKDEQATTTRLQREIQALGPAQRQRYQASAEAGRKAAQQVLAMMRSDRAAAPWTGSVPTEEGKWSSLAQPPAPPAGPNLGAARTFFLSSGADYRAPPPPPFGSPQFQAQVRQVRTISDSRTNEQIRIAQYWENLTGSFAAGAWNIVARSAMAARNFDEARTARTLAMMHMVGYDANIACHESKYAYWVPRPTQADPQITLAIGAPNHPSYPSNHACISGAIGFALDAMLPGTNGLYGAMARQAGSSRLYAGIHYQMDLDEGYAIARKITDRALQIGIAPDRPFAPLGR